MPVSPPAPHATNVLAGRQVFTVTTAATTLITIPAGRTWVGQIGASVACALTAAITNAGRASAEFSVAGDGVIPTAGAVFGVDALTGANAATGTVGNGAANSSHLPLVVAAPPENSVTIKVAATCTGTTSRVDAYASGALVAL